jgi:fatty acid desaturase
MRLLKLLTIIISYLLGFYVTLTGLAMIPEPLAVPWIVFNLWLFLVAPVAVIWVDRNERKKEAKLRNNSEKKTI